MKRIFTLLLALPAFFSNAQNADLTFDQPWVPGTIYTATEPVGWISSNVVTAPLITFPLPNTNATTLSQSTTVFTSSPKAARLITKKVTPGVLSTFGFGDTTGFMITGKLVGLSSISFGYTYGSKSAQLDFQYNYQPTSATDRGLVSVIFLKRNGANRDTIATGFTLLNASPSTTAFQTGTVLMVYNNVNGPAPDTAIIGAASSVANVKNLLGSLNIGIAPASINSTLILDDLNFSGTVNVSKNTIEEKFVRVAYNANAEALDVNLSKDYVGTSKIKVYNITGKLIASKPINATTQRIEMKGTPTGMYLYSLTDQNDKAIKSGKLIVAQ